MKRCRKCGEEKPLSDFYAMAGMRDGYRNDCKTCNLAAKAARHRANPGPARERARRWRKEHPEEYARQIRESVESGRRAVANRRYHLKKKYGLTPEEYDAMFAAQGGGCAICGRPPAEGISLHVDHDHATGDRRGLLCFRCNNALGDFGDDGARITQAADYLLGHDPEMQEMKRLAKERAAALR